MVVVDTSALLALVLDEPHAPWVLQQLGKFKQATLMSTVNLAEALIIVRSRHKKAITAEAAERQLMASELRYIPPSVEHARLAAIARHRYPLNLGDCFAYALSASENCPILTLDEDFQSCDRPLIILPKA
jgi:ribonuclease VapC